MKKSAWFCLVASLAINAALVVAFAMRRTEVETHPLPPTPAKAAAGALNAKGNDAPDRTANAAKANATTPTGGMSAGAEATTRNLWELLSSREPATFAANLRAAGFTTGSMRGAIYALLRDLQTDERVKAVDSITSDSFWKIGGSPESFAAYSKEISRLWLDRDRVMRGIFPEEQLAFTLRMQARFGPISAEKMEKISALEQDYSEMQSQLRSQSRTGGLQMPWGGEQLAYLEQEKMKDMAALLSPAEMEQYQMRGSPLGGSLQRQLDGFEPTEQEYREIYRQRAAAEEAGRAGGPLYSMTPEGARAQQNLEAGLKSALGEARYAEYQRGQDYTYHMALRVTRNLDLPASMAAAVYDLQRDLKQREGQIRSAGGQDAAQRETQLAALATEAKQKLSALLTPAGAEQYTKDTAGRMFFMSR